MTLDVRASSVAGDVRQSTSGVISRRRVTDRTTADDSADRAVGRAGRGTPHLEGGGRASARLAHTTRTFLASSLLRPGPTSNSTV